MSLGAGAFKKAIKTREHRERAQPASRSKLGILEKHKDYVLRARDYHKKQDTLKALKIRASNRNPDEFNFGMIKSRLKDGKHVSDFTERSKSIPAGMLKLMKTQDVSYISTQLNSNRKKLELAEQDLSLNESALKRGTVRQHVFFAEDADEKEDLVSKHKTEEEDDKDESESLKKEEFDMLAEFEVDAVTKELEKKRSEVEARRERVNQLEKLEYKMTLDRQLLSKGKREKIGADEYGFAKYKWASERKK